MTIPEKLVWKSGRLKRGHIAQALSHRNAWRRFLTESDLGHVIILEDDADVNWNFKDIFGAILEKLDDIAPSFHDDYDLLYLRVPWDDFRDEPPLHINQFLNHPYAFAKLTGYMISRRGAKKLLDLSSYLDRPLPNLVNHLVLTKQLTGFVLRQRGLIGDKGQHPRTLKDPSVIPMMFGDKIKSRIDYSPAWGNPPKTSSS